MTTMTWLNKNTGEIVEYSADSYEACERWFRRTFSADERGEFEDITDYRPYWMR